MVAGDLVNPVRGVRDAPVDVPSADHDPELDAKVVHALDLRRVLLQDGVAMIHVDRHQRLLNGGHRRTVPDGVLAQTVKHGEIVAFPDLGPEAIWRLEVVDFPVVVALDTDGNDVFDRSTQR